MSISTQTRVGCGAWWIFRAPGGLAFRPGGASVYNAGMNWIASLLRALWPGWRRRGGRHTPAEFAPDIVAGSEDTEQARPVEPRAASDPAPSVTPPLLVPIADVAPAGPVLAPEPVGLDALAAEDDDLEEEDQAISDDEDEDDPLAPDPFVSPIRPTEETLSAEDLAIRRAASRAAALIGEHKIYFSDTAGPGTLAEALNQLLQEGRVTAEFRDEGGEDAHLLYRVKSS